VTSRMAAVAAAFLSLAAVPAGSAAQEVAAPAARASGAVLTGELRQGGLVRGEAPAGAVAVELDGKPVPLSGDRRFLIGFDRDASAQARLLIRFADGRTSEQIVPVAPGAWRIERIDVARRPGGASEAYRKLREGEMARIAAARARTNDVAGWRQRFVWPARGRISGVFGSQRFYRGEPAAFHSGVDVAPGAGALVVAPADGVVVLAGPPQFSLEGNLVIIDHGLGLNSAFLHLGSVAVRQGQPVRQGDPIGTVGATGRATGPHLHWSMKWQDARIDPQRLVAATTD
jgi:murein DD-endopeptidase MepM/ murein hydrolase activator NlpD